MFSREYCDIFKGIYLEEHLRTAASVILSFSSFFSFRSCPNRKEKERHTEGERETERESQREKKLHLIRLGATRFWFGCFSFAQLHCKILIFPSLSRHYNFLFDNLQANHNRWCTAPLRYNNYNGIVKANDAI